MAPLSDLPSALSKNSSSTHLRSQQASSTSASSSTQQEGDTDFRIIGALLGTTGALVICLVGCTWYYYYRMDVTQCVTRLADSSGHDVKTLEAHPNGLAIGNVIYQYEKKQSSKAVKHAWSEPNCQASWECDSTITPSSLVASTNATKASILNRPSSTPSSDSGSTAAPSTPSTPSVCSVSSRQSCASQYKSSSVATPATFGLKETALDLRQSRRRTPAYASAQAGVPSRVSLSSSRRDSASAQAGIQSRASHSSSPRPSYSSPTVPRYHVDQSSKLHIRARDALQTASAGTATNSVVARSQQHSESSKEPRRSLSQPAHRLTPNAPTTVHPPSTRMRKELAERRIQQ